MVDVRARVRGLLGKALAPWVDAENVEHDATRAAERLEDALWEHFATRSSRAPKRARREESAEASQNARGAGDDAGQPTESTGAARSRDTTTQQTHSDSSGTPQTAPGSPKDGGDRRATTQPVDHAALQDYKDQARSIAANLRRSSSQLATQLLDIGEDASSLFARVAGFTANEFLQFDPTRQQLEKKAEEERWSELLADGSGDAEFPFRADGNGGNDYQECPNCKGKESHFRTLRDGWFWPRSQAGNLRADTVIRLFRCDHCLEVWRVEGFS